VEPCPQITMVRTALGTLPCMGTLPNGEVLDVMDSPIGELRLFAFGGGDDVWVGVRAESGEVLGAIGLRTGSRYREVEVTASIDRDWAVTWGGISSRAAQAEIRNEAGQSFEARIVPLPDQFASTDQAVWGLALPCHDAPAVVGFDEDGNPFGA
jgi:hypothetical protein